MVDSRVKTGIGKNPLRGSFAFNPVQTTEAVAAGLVLFANGFVFRSRLRIMAVRNFCTVGGVLRFAEPGAILVPLSACPA